MNIKYKLMIVLVACLSCRPLFSTGPSDISVSIIPIARNSSGQILCKTRSSANPMGASWYMPVYLSLCVVSAEGIIEAQELASFIPIDYETADEIADALNTISELFKGLTINVKNDVLVYFIEKYNFTIAIDIENRECEEIVLKQSDYENAQILSIGNRSFRSLQGRKIKVYYRYENMYFVINGWSSWQDTEYNIGALFDESKEYDGYSIDGILILNNKQSGSNR
ncbi:MAG: hypothetical protein JW822_03875 [Spirochaetales bacterium]|nr:hypothetical protein [Spirochaetales bacterium]